MSDLIQTLRDLASLYAEEDPNTPIDEFTVTQAATEIEKLQQQLAEANARIDELETKEALYDEHSDAVKKCLALNKQLVATEKALRWACNIYIVDDYYTGDLRKERLEIAVNYAMKRGNLKKQTEARGRDD